MCHNYLDVKETIVLNSHPKEVLGYKNSAKSNHGKYLIPTPSVFKNQTSV